ncbi:AAA family ATPase [Flammeovirga sp. EKP202]|uniref:AAA family ATPase n=1 Tax=Flammeovirga sp. EKP202 TaxID=2770592 RepID=UPI00165F3B13|nr:AAA family ATPase [Flammeovirga sp. EKP202]MBD0399965.1 ATP-binding protein [Flammeovirga sp. EKP202]
MKKLILLRGLPGAGKTTVAQAMGGSIEADDFMVNENGEYQFDPRNLPFAHKQCEEMVKLCMSRSQELIVVSNTFTTEDEMKNYFVMAEKYGYQVSSLIVENRHGSKSIHNVPDSNIKRMMERFEIKL